MYDNVFKIGDRVWVVTREKLGTVVHINNNGGIQVKIDSYKHNYSFNRVDLELAVNDLNFIAKYYKEA